MTPAPRHAVSSCARLVRFAALLSAFATAAIAPAARAADPASGPPLTIKRAAGAIVLDGDLSDAGWQGIDGVTTWFETNVGDNVEPQVKNLAYLAYDEKYFYAGFQLDDPQPASIRAPIGDHDAMPGSTDYAGLIIDSHNDGKTAQMFLANAHGVQYDAITNDATGEDSAPDFFWDAVAKVTPTGWNLEIRIPFSSLRYAGGENPTWGLLLYRNYPRDRHYQFFSARLPRDVNCFICNSSKLTGLAALPHGSHLVVAPFATAQRTDEPNVLGAPLDAGKFESEVGMDVKWNPSAALALDGTINPDFSQIESDAAQIATNERFALFFPEKRTFFLEGIDLFSTPLQAVYTRTVTAPNGGARATGKIGTTAYTALFAQDKGGGSVILPGAQGSGFADQDFKSDVGIARVRHDLGRSFVSLLMTDRDVDGGGSNRVIGPDFQWRPTPSDAISGQALYSESHTPNRTDLAAEWDGRLLSDHAGLLNWSHGTRSHDWFVQGQDFGPDFRADNGFISQVGYSEVYSEGGYTIRPKKAFFSRIRLFTVNWYDWTPDHSMLTRRVSVGAGADGRWSSFVRVELNRDSYLVGNEVLDRFRPHLILQANPTRVWNAFSLDISAGPEADFANGREGTGVSLAGALTVRPNDHLALAGSVTTRTLNVNDATLGLDGRLFFAQVERVRTTYSFSSRSFIRLIGQYQQTDREPALYSFSVPVRSAQFTSSALFAYKLNWQTVFFAGYGDAHTFEEVSDKLQPSSRQMFAKISYAWQQ